ncbi:alanine--tRNA ligase [Patescibacteria group bacterium]|nr:alanine--tRNA ligase [Patescibacteria group bacterium]MCG2694546.1 alanine--tRNA ligase-related protein [Candidatus Parcubacteria bacterium]
MNSNEIRQRFLNFFEKRGHTIIPSASLIPENDPSVLFNTAGMQPLVPYLLGEKHPTGNRIVDIQKCVRTTDIDEVGDNTHLTFFEMLGNWSLGDYFKKEAINWSYEFLTDEKEGLGLNPSRLYVTVFEGNNDAPKDEDSFEIWKEIFEKAGLKQDGHIFFMPAKSNWWPQPKNNDSYSGPCGPDSEMFYSTVGDLGDLTKEEFIKADDEQKVVEIWNDVFMEYEKKNGKVVGKLKQKNVDTGAGLERLAVMMQEKKNVYETDLFSSIMDEINSKSQILNSKQTQNKNDQNSKLNDATNFASQNSSDEEQSSSSLRASERSGEAWQSSVNPSSLREQSSKQSSVVNSENELKSKRIIADHIRTAVFMISDGVVPSNTDRGYILRRIIRRAIRHMHLLGIEENCLVDLADIVIKQYGEIYENIKNNAEQIKEEIRKEEDKFRQTLEKGLKAFDRLISHDETKPQMTTIEISGKDFFNLFQTYGFPFEMIVEEIKHRDFLTDGKEMFNAFNEEIKKQEFEEEMKKHQELSRTSSVGKFKGGLGGHDENSTKLHTATHLLNQALKEVLGNHIEQKGSNITPERLRFDFSHPEKLTDEEKQKVEEIVNQKIQEALPVTMEEMTVDEAKEKGATGVFGDKYGEKVKVYSIGNPNASHGQVFSKEICGGPHVENTKELGYFKIKKEEASSAGVRRIKAELSTE